MELLTTVTKARNIFFQRPILLNKFVDHHSMCLPPATLRYDNTSRSIIIDGGISSNYSSWFFNLLIEFNSIQLSSASSALFNSITLLMMTLLMRMKMKWQRRCKLLIRPVTKFHNGPVDNTLKSNFVFNFVPNSSCKGYYADGWTCLSTLAQKNQSKRLAATSKNDRHCCVCGCVF